MSIAEAIQNAQQKVANAYAAVSAKGGTLPITQNLSNLPAAIGSIPEEESASYSPDPEYAIVEAYNNTGATVNEGDKVWMNKSGSSYNLINFSSKQFNGTLEGTGVNVDLNTGLATNFANGYISVDSAGVIYNATLIMKITTGNDVSSFQEILRFYPLAEFYIRNGEVRLWSKTEQAETTCTTLNTNTTYWFKVVCADSMSKLSYSLDGVAYTGEVSLQNSYYSHESTCIGNYNNERPFLGSFDLTQCYFTINGSEYWRGCTTTLNPSINENTQTGISAETIPVNTTGDVYINALYPSGIIEITENGLINVSGYAQADINVASGSGRIISATNDSGATISSGDKVWLTKNNSTYTIVNQSRLQNNFGLTGTDVVISNGVASGFSTSSYLSYFPIPIYNKFLSITKFTTGSDVSTMQNIMRYNSFTEVYISGGDLKTWSESAFGDVTCGTVQPNTTYWVKLVVENDTEELSYSTDGVTYTGNVTISNNIRYSNAFNIGYCHSGTPSRYFRGSIDLKESYIVLNDSPAEYWRGCTTVLNNVDFSGVAAENIGASSSGNVYLNSLYPTGTLNITQNGTSDVSAYANVEVEVTTHDEVTALNNTGSPIAPGSKVWLSKNGNTYTIENFYGSKQNFLADNSWINNKVYTYGNVSYYTLRIDRTIDFSNHWEMNFKVTTSNDVTTRQKLNGSSQGIDKQFPTLEINTWQGYPKFFIHLSIDGSEWGHTQGGSYEVLPNTTYWIKFGWSGNSYYVDYSTDGSSFTRDILFDNAPLSVYNSFATMAIGNDDYGNGYLPFLGSIDLNETYIKYGNSVYWTPYETIINDTFTSGIAGEYILANQSGVVGILTPFDANHIVLF